MIHFYRYISALTVLLIAFSTYAVAVAPWFEPPPIRRPQTVGNPPSPTPPASDEKKAILAALFPPGHWALGNPKIVETEQCTLLIQDYKSSEGGNLVLEPCVLIFRARTLPAPTDDGKTLAKHSRPIVLEAPRAELAFDRPLDVTRTSFGRVEKGTLAGEVMIYSPPTTPTSGDELRVKTRAVWLDRQSIRTSNDVEFQYGDSSGRGRILEIALRSGEESDKQKTKSQLGPLQTVTLKHLDYLRLATAGRGVLAGAIPAAKAAGAGSSVEHVAPHPAASPPLSSDSRRAGTAGSANDDNAPIELRCQGEFTFDCLAQVARFERQVEVKRLLPSLPPDTLRCDELLLVFGEREEPKVAPTNPVAAAGDDPLAGRLRRLVAIGSPATLEAPASGLFAVAAHMEYSLAERQVMLKADNRRNVPQVSLRQQDNQFTAPELQYQMTNSSRLGRLLATGPGNLRMLEGEGAEQRTISARWEKSLQIQPQDQFQLISLMQAASVTIDPLGRFDGNELHLWVEELGDRGQEAGDGGQRLAGGGQNKSLAPNRLLAVGGVRVVSEQLDVDTNRLEAWFVNLPTDAAGGIPQRAPPMPPQPIHEPVQPAAWNAAPQNTVAAGPQAAIRDIQPRGLQKFHVGGDKIQLRSIIRGRLFELEDLLIDGKTDILETRTPEANLEPIFARGTRLELRQGSSPTAMTMKIDGQPAEIGGRGMSLAGRTIDLARGRNELRIDGLGEALMPLVQGSGFRVQGSGDTEQSGQRAASSNSAEPGRSNQKLHVVWHDGLIFDGLTARIGGDVEMRTATQLARAPILEVTLSQRVDFQSIGGTASASRRAASGDKPAAMPVGQPELARVFLDGGMSGVYLSNNSLDERGQLVSREQMRARDLVVDRLTGNMRAQGPGWVSSVRKQGSEQPQPWARGQGPGIVEQGSGEREQLISIHVAFEKEMVGDLNTRQIEFHQQVETTYSPAGDFAELIAADPIKDLGERMILMTSDMLKVTEFLQPPARWIEVQATGNTKVRGQKFNVDAPIVSYSSQKETLKIEGNGRASAKAWVQQLPGDKPNSFEGERFTYNLRTGEWQTDVIKSIHINLPPNIKLPAMPGAAPTTTTTNSTRRFP